MRRRQRQMCIRDRYTGMVYKGPTIASKINKDLDEIVKREGFKNISEAIGTKN